VITASEGVADWASTTGAKTGSGEPAVADVVGDGWALGGAEGVRDGFGVGLGRLGDGVAVGEDDGVAVGEDDGVAVGEDDGVAVGEDDGVAVGEDDGVAVADGEADGVGVAAGVAVGVAGDDGVSDGVPADGAAADVGVDEPEAGAASAGRIIATVEILAAGPGGTLACTAPALADETPAAAVPATGAHVRPTAAHALMAATTVSALRPALSDRTLSAP